MKRLTLLLVTLSLAACSSGTPDTQPPVGFTPVWTAEQAPGSKAPGDTPPHMWLSLVNQNNAEKIYQADCEGTINAIAIDGAMAAVQCWWAGGGQQYAVYDIGGGEYILRMREVDEESGELPWKDLKTVK